MQNLTPLVKITPLTLLVLVYVDDILKTSSDATTVSELISHLHYHFALKDLGPLPYFFGIEVTLGLIGLHLCQHKYILDLVDRYSLASSKPMDSPMASAPVLTP